MKSKFVVILPLNIQQLNLGFYTYKETATIVCEASTAIEVYMKYPQAIAIKQMEKIK
jgi:hypothetical protein